MSLLTQASLIMTPNAIKENKVYSIIPTNGNGDFTFTRATLASSTLNNDAGLIETVPYNLLSYSEQFDNASFWSKINSATITANTTTAPNGTLTADTLNFNGTAFGQIQQALLKNTGETYTFSIWIKSNSSTSIDLYIGSDFSTINTVTSSWQRFSITKTITTASASPKLVSSLVGSFDIWGAQLVQGSLPKDYFFTTDRLNVPRLNYDTAGSCPSLLLEPQRTNIARYSQDMDVSGTWGVDTGVSVIANSSISPSGLQNAETISITANSIFIRGIHQYPSFAVSSTYTLSVFAKKNTVNFLGIKATALTGSPIAWFDLNNGTVGTVQSGITSGNIISVGNGWYRCSILITTPAVIVVNRFDLAVFNTNGSQACNNGDSIFVFGAQAELGAYPTSYIPTTTATVTRNLDNCYKTGISTDILNSSEGTFYVEAASIANDLTQKYIEITDSSDNNRISIDFGAINNSLRLQTIGGFAIYRVDVAVSNITSYNKVLIKWGSSGKFAYVNGTKYTLNLISGSGTGIPVGLNQVSFMQWWGGTPFYGKSKGMQIYKTALTDAECAALTT